MNLQNYFKFFSQTISTIYQKIIKNIRGHVHIISTHHTCVYGILYIVYKDFF